MMPTLIEAALRSLVLALAVWGGLRIFRVRNVVAQKVAWGLVLAAASFMPILAPWLGRTLPAGASIVVPLRPVVQSTVPDTTTSIQARQNINATPAVISRSVMPAPSAARKSGTRFSKPEPAPLVASEIAPALNTGAVDTSELTAAPASEPMQAAPAHFPLSLPAVGLLLYLVVAGALLFRLLYGLASALHLLFSAKPIPEGTVARLAGTLRPRASTAVASPVTIGSAIVLPASYTEWDQEKLRVVLAHERSHIRQGDFYLQFLAGLYAALVWFSPLGWWLKRTLSDLAETISDRAGLEEAPSSTSYAQILLEFAAAPRPTVLGVAMARSGSLSRRIERLLNDTAFRQAFAGGRRRALIAVLLVPIALVVTTALVRVQAAQDVQPASPATPAGPSAPATAASPAKPSPAHPAAPESFELVSDDEADGAVLVAPRVIVIPAIPKVGPIPPIPAITVQVPQIDIPPISVKVPKIPPMPPISVTVPKVAMNFTAPMVPVAPGQFSFFSLAQDDDSGHRHGHGARYRYMIDGDSYALITGDHQESMNFSGDLHTGDIDKIRQLAHGDFLWFERDDKQYFIDDPAIIAEIKAMYKPMDELGRQQDELGKKQDELGRQQDELGRRQEQASVPAPDMQKEMAEIDAAMAKIRAKMGQNVTQDELGDLQSKLGDLQGKLGDLEGKIGERQGQLGAEQGRLGEQQGKLGAEQGRLGAEQGRIAREADRKVRSIISDSLQNGKAHPVN
jgi:beta-lactamase regulating signal transducer with metallopeptidase domain